MSSKPKKLVVFCKTFLPEYNPESIRTAAFIKYMIRDGWEVFLFTYSMGDITDSKYSFLKNVSITRVPQVTHSMHGIGYGVNYIWQLIGTLWHIRTTIMKNKISFMFVSVPQLQPLIVGALTKMIFPSIRLVQEFRDTYSISELTSRSKTKSRILQQLEKRLMKFGDDFIFVTSIIKDEYVKYFGQDLPRLATGKVILNGFDPEDYPENPIMLPKPGLIRMAYTGNLYGSRNLDLFLEGLGRALQQLKNYKSSVEVVIAGNVSTENMLVLKNIIATYYLDENVIFLGNKTHEECVKIQCSSTFNILVTHKTGSFYAIPSKIFEYAASKRPILAITADPLVKDILKTHNFGIDIPHNTEAITNGLIKLLTSKIPDGGVAIPKEFRRDYQIRKIAEVIYQ